MTMLAIYTPELTNRIRYTFDLVLKETLGLNYSIYQNIEEFAKADGPKLSYHKEPITSILSFGAAGLLSEKGLRPQQVSVSTYNGLKVIYQLEEGKFCLPFDPFSAAFYLVSRYEEYLPHKVDLHGRFPARDSLAARSGFLQIPVVDYYIKLVEDVLKANFSGLKFRQRTFSYTPTYDIDSAYAYRNKGLIRNLGGYAKSLIDGHWATIKDRTQVLFRLKDDPFDTYDWMRALHDKYGLKPVYFFLVGEYDEYDKGISFTISAFQSLIKSIGDHADVGIHPSYASNEQPEKLAMEIKRLQGILKTEIKKSRQHFLRVHFPKTQEQLLQNDIEEDYTMGYAGLPGFRASIARPFYFYNIEQENRTNLKIVPFAIMDATFQYYLKLQPEESLERIMPLVEETKKVGGEMVSLFHNNSFAEDREWEGWRAAYSTMIDNIMR